MLTPYVVEPVVAAALARALQVYETFRGSHGPSHQDGQRVVEVIALVEKYGVVGNDALALIADLEKFLELGEPDA